MLILDHQRLLLTIARQSIDAHLSNTPPPDFSRVPESLTHPQGAFVSLYKNGELRGCIGVIEGKEPLYLTVSHMAVESAVGDPRFSPLTSAALGGIVIEISVLSPLVRVADAGDIQLGIHGVMVKKGFCSGVFLPQVASTTGWSKEEFLSFLCAHKARLPADAWKQPGTELYTFTAQVIREKE
jgi:AmmeMemoRadiSam system protein A